MNSLQNPRIAGKVVIVTDASSGIGEATAQEFGRAGACVVLAARWADRLQRGAEAIADGGSRALAVPTDLTKIEQITHLVDATWSAFGRIAHVAHCEFCHKMYRPADFRLCC